jgi:phosphate/sulfate permease
MSKPSRYLASHIATATSTIIGVLGLFLAAAEWLPSRFNYKGGRNITLEIVLPIVAGLVAGFAAKYVNSSIKEKETEKEEEIDAKP